jgi:hypothetical protein
MSQECIMETYVDMLSCPCLVLTRTMLACKWSEREHSCQKWERIVPIENVPAQMYCSQIIVTLNAHFLEQMNLRKLLLTVTRVIPI